MKDNQFGFSLSSSLSYVEALCARFGRQKRSIIGAHGPHTDRNSRDLYTGF
jgi:hypothetical protein